MKQLLSLFLFLLPCLAWAQYPSNGNQKITLGEQTTADGLIYRGVAADTTLTAKSDTAAYFVLDTVNINLYTYKASATGRKWIQLGSDTTSLNLVSRFATKLNISDTASMLTPYWRAGRFSGVLPVANGGTGASVRTFVDTINTQTVNGAKTFTSAVAATRFNPTANTVTGTGMFAPTSTSLGFSISGTNKLTLNSSGNLGLGVAPSAWGISFKVFQMGATSLYEESAVATKLGNNVYFSDANRYYANSGASSYTQQFGGHIFYVASDGTANNPITFTNAMQISQDANVGIGVAVPTQKLHVVGNARFEAVGAGAYANDLNITSTGVLTTASSDEKYKYNILPINYGLNTILQLKPVNFQWIKGEENDLGFIAQDVAEIIPEAVDTNWNSDLLMRYESIIPILTKAIQEQNLLIKALEQRIINLENK